MFFKFYNSIPQLFGNVLYTKNCHRHYHLERIKKRVIHFLAKICPQLEAPVVETWDSYAILQKSGIKYGNCIYDGQAHSSDNIWVKWKERINEGPNGNYKDTYELKFSLTEAMSDLVVNVTFSMTPSLIEGKIFLENCSKKFQTIKSF